MRKRGVLVSCNENLAQPPEYAPAGQTKCGVTKSQAEPLIVEWPDASRAKLESMKNKSVVPVRYEGCEMAVLSQCTAPAQYRYAPVTTKRKTENITSEDELYAKVPIGAAGLEAHESGDRRCQR